MRQINKYSKTASAVPGVAQVISGLTVNTNDGNIHIKQDNSGVEVVELYKGMKIHKVQDEAEKDNL